MMSNKDSELLERLLEAKAKGKILPLRQTVDSWWVCTIHHSAVPNYDYEGACKGLSDDGIQQELEISWSQVSGKRVYPQFNRNLHIALEPLEYNPRQPIYAGWDFGSVPAFVPTQINAFGQWLIFPPIAPGEEASLGVHEFGQIVADCLIRDYCIPHNIDLKHLRIVHFGDPAGAARPPRVGDSPKETRSCFEILDKGIEIIAGVDEDGSRRIIRKPGWGWKIRPGKVGITERLEAVRARLMMLLRDGLPALVVDPRAESIKEGFLGAYSFAQRRDGSYEYHPDKNWWSHQFDAMAYIATRLFSQTQQDEEDEDSPVNKQEFVSHAANRYDRL